MNTSLYIILIHQFVFQGMFVAKNVYLKRKIGKQIKGKNKETVISIMFFTVFIATSIIFALTSSSIGTFHIVDISYAYAVSSVLLALNLIISATSLVNMKDSWRVGVLEEQETQLVEDGIYHYSRNPYFLSYVLMFIAYTVLLQNVILLSLTIVGVILIHSMIKKEEEYLLSIHSKSYAQYRKRVARYFLI